METKEDLARKIEVADWFYLRAHLERGGLIVVGPGLDLAEVGLKVASDEVPVVEAWILDGMLAKPTHVQVKKWDMEKGKTFRCLIVSPYVLIQDLGGQ